MIRALGSTDREAALDLLRATGSFTPTELAVAAEVVDAAISQPDPRDYHAFVAEVGGGLAGLVIVGPTPATESTWHLYWIAVHPAHQGTGIGQRLEDFAESLVRACHGTWVIVETSSQPGYDRPRRFYERRGYRRLAEIPDYYRAGDDLILYGKRLLPLILVGSLALMGAGPLASVGHQVHYGSDTVQADLTGGPYYEEPDPASSDPRAAVGRVAADPEGKALFLSGYGNCVFDGGAGYDLEQVRPIHATRDDALFWSTPNMTAGDWDGDRDREAKIPSGGSALNMWQGYPSSFEAFTANFDALEFDVEAGSVSASALVQIWLSATPLEVQSPWVTISLDCALGFWGPELGSRRAPSCRSARLPRRRSWLVA